MLNIRICERTQWNLIIIIVPGHKFRLTFTFYRIMVMSGSVTREGFLRWIMATALPWELDPTHLGGNKTEGLGAECRNQQFHSPDFSQQTSSELGSGFLEGRNQWFCMFWLFFIISTMGVCLRNAEQDRQTCLTFSFTTIAQCKGFWN